LSTIFDLISLAVFAGLAILYLQRSSEDPPVDRIYQYIPAAVGCAASNWFGNHQHAMVAAGVMLAVIVYTVVILKPFRPKL
jgi:uncharacterized membrane protein YkvA (DUF1232 family)